MGLRPFRQTAAVIATAGVVLLGMSLPACTPQPATPTVAVPTVAAPTAAAPSEPEEPPEPSTSDSPEQSLNPSPESTESGDTECVVGVWNLDVEDYRSQAEAYLLSLSIPVESFEMEGGMIVGINPIYFDIASSIVTKAVVHGVPISAPGEFAGGADWQWEADDATTMSFDDWSWSVEPGSADGPAVPPLINPGQPLTVGCEGDQLTLHAPGAPLVGHFTRGG